MRKDKYFCECCQRAFRSSSVEPVCPHCGCQDDIYEYEGQDLIGGEEVFDMVDEGVVPMY